VHPAAPVLHCWILRLGEAGQISRILIDPQDSNIV